eukprot:6514272-Pyramimonas_sp.AAC.1
MERPNTSPGVDGQKGLLSKRSTVDTSIPFSARHFDYSTDYSTYIPCRQTAIGWPTVDSGGWPNIGACLMNSSPLGRFFGGIFRGIYIFRGRLDFSSGRAA